MKNQITFLLLLLTFAPFFSSAQIITTIAGTPGVNGYSGDGGQATNAKIGGSGSANGIATDNRGNLYISDYLRIRKVDSFGIINTIAGNGVWVGAPTDTGDGYPATAVSLFYTGNIGADYAGNLFFDTYLGIRKISPSGILSTMITSVNGGNFVGLNGPATAAGYASTGLSGSSLWVDSVGQLYYADSCQCIRKIASDGIVRIVAGQGCADTTFNNGAPATATGLGGIACITTDAHGAIYYTGGAGSGSSAFGRVVKIDATGVLHLLAGTGVGGYTTDGSPASSAALSDRLRGIAVDKDGTVYFVETHQSGAAPQSSFVRKISPTGILTTVAGILDSAGFSGDGGPATAAKLSGDVAHLSLNTNGDLYINDIYNYCIRKIKHPVLVVNNVTPLELANLAIAPNPTSNGTFTIRCTAKRNEDMDVSITAMDGRQAQRLHAKTNEPLPIQLTVKGIYLVTADLNGQQITQRVTVQ